MWLQTPLEFCVAAEPLLLIKRGRLSEADVDQSETALGSALLAPKNYDSEGDAQ